MSWLRIASSAVGFERLMREGAAAVGFERQMRECALDAGVAVKEWPG